MKTIEEMAHDYLCSEIAHSGMNMINEHDAVRMAFLFAEAMQAESEKRKAKKDTVSLTKDGNGNCLHLHHEFGHKKCMDCGAFLSIEMREQFEKLPGIVEIIKYSSAIYCNKNDWYLCSFEHREDEAFLDGAWYAFQEQEKKIKSLERLIDRIYSANEDSEIKSIIDGWDD